MQSRFEPATIVLCPWDTTVFPCDSIASARFVNFTRLLTCSLDGFIESRFAYPDRCIQQNGGGLHSSLTSRSTPLRTRRERPIISKATPGVVPATAKLTLGITAAASLAPFGHAEEEPNSSEQPADYPEGESPPSC